MATWQSTCLYLKSNYYRNKQNLAVEIAQKRLEGPLWQQATINCLTVEKQTVPIFI